MFSRVSSFTILVVFFLSACARNANKPTDFDPTIFKNDRFDVTLGFDLRNDDQPTAGLFINAQGASVSTLKTVVLPFASSSARASEELFSTWGSFDDTTLVNYYLSPATYGYFFIGIVPTFQPSPEIYTRPEDVQYSVALVRMGLERVFVYKYPETDPIRTSWLKKEGAFANTAIDAIGIAYPKDAEGKEIRDTGLTAIPVSYPFRNGKARFYPATSILAGNVKALEVKYKLAPTQPQKLFSEYGVKLVIALIAPLTQLMIKNPKGKRNKIIIYVLLGIQVIIVIGLVFFAIRSWGESSIKTFLDLLIALVSGSLIGYVWWQEKKKS